jgi:hypothetical protein
MRALLSAFVLALSMALAIACGGTHGIGSSANTTSGSSSSGSSSGGGSPTCGPTPGGATTFFPWQASLGQPTGPIVVDGKNLYFGGAKQSTGPATPATLTVVQVDKGGASAPVVLGTYSGDIDLELAVSPTDVYWTVNGSLTRVPIGGGTFTSLGSIAVAYDMAIDATALYWPSPSGGNVVSEMLLPGGTATILVTNAGAQGSWSLAVAGGSVFYNYGVFGMSDKMSEIRRVPAGGGPVVSIATNQNDAASVAVDATRVYWANAGESILAAPQQGGTPTVLASGLKYAAGLVVDGTNLYFSAACGIYKMPVSGGTPALVAASTTPAFAVDAAHVYWIDGSTRGFFKGPK